MLAAAFGPLGLTPEQALRLDYGEIETMREGWSWRHQLLLRVIAQAVWWIVYPTLSEDARVRFTPSLIARTFPGFVRHPDFDSEDEQQE